MLGKQLKPLFWDLGEGMLFVPVVGEAPQPLVLKWLTSAT